MSYGEIWSKLKTHFNIAKYEQLPYTRFKAAMDYLYTLNAPLEKVHLNSVDEETLSLMINLYGFCYQAYEMQEKLKGTPLAKQMESTIGGQYLYNFKQPLEQTMAKMKSFIQSNAERTMLVKAMHNLLN